MTTISYHLLNLTKNLIFSLLLTSQIVLGKELIKMKNPSGIEIELELALTQKQHTQGLSGLKSNEFKKSKGMLFVNPSMGPRRFWMPNTYFNLDIIFLDQDLKIVAIEKNIPAHPGLTGPPAIYKTDTYLAQFVLETRADADFGKNLKKNDSLKLIGPTSLSEIVSKTHLLQ